MTTFEDLQKAWTTQAARLDAATSLHAERARLEAQSRLKKPLRGLIIWLVIEITLCTAGMLVNGSFVADHIREFRFVLPSATINLWLLATLIAAIRQIVLAAKVQFGEPIATVQEQIAELRVLRLRAFRWIFLTGQIVWWIPFLVTGLRMFFGVDAYRFLPPSFFIANVVAGILLVPLLLLLTKRLSTRQRSRWYGRLANIIAGHSLTEALRQAEMIASFSK